MNVAVFLNSIYFGFFAVSGDAESFKETLSINLGVRVDSITLKELADGEDFNELVNDLPATHTYSIDTDSLKIVYRNNGEVVAEYPFTDYVA